MSKLNDFLNRSVDANEEIIEGTYGCNTCNEDLPFARFNASTGRYYWICSQGHTTEMNLV
jgi:RNA polymerase-binding transcription factor DksA